MEVYLVGGAVRDLLMGIEPKDKDYVVVDSTREEMLELGYEEVGKGFPVFIHPDTGCEYALARKERKVHSDTLNDHQSFEFETEYVTLIEDLMRRDLTINSIALDEKTGIFYDPYNGLKDIKEKRLAHTSSAFIEDPLRVLRVARFNARFPDFLIDGSTSLLMGAVASSDGFKSLPMERVFGEFEKALGSSRPDIFIDVLRRSGADWHFREMYNGFDSERYNKIMEREKFLHKKTKHFTIMDLATEMLKLVSGETKSVESRYVAFASGLTDPKRFGLSIKAPTDWINESVRVKEAFDENESVIEKDNITAAANSLHKMFIKLNVFRSTNTFAHFLIIAKMKGYYDIDYLMNMYKCVISVTAKDVNPELKGKDIGEEMTRLRIKELEKCIQNSWIDLQTITQINS